jgi:hypothetical protein
MHDLHRGKRGKRLMAEERPGRNYLTFQLLDDILLLPKSEWGKKIGGCIAHRIGPLVEYALFDHASGQSYLSRSKTMQADMLSRVLQATPSALSSRATSLDARPLEFLKTPHTNAAFGEPWWIAFCKRLESAIQSAGLPGRFAGQLAGTFGEMVSNLVEHSGHPETGLVGYQWRQGELEYVVADNGIGLLNSLKKHPDYAFLVDAGQALDTALKDGESRHGRQAGRGTGFNTLILNIASHNSYLRFRSGDHCHTIDGTRLVPRLTRQLGSDFQGFLVSVVCRS